MVKVADLTTGTSQSLVTVHFYGSLHRRRRVLLDFPVRVVNTPPQPALVMVASSSQLVKAVFTSSCVIQVVPS
jgi:hypothetical protein